MSALDEIVEAEVEVAEVEVPLSGYHPVVGDDCGVVTWSHPATSTGFGTPANYVVSVNGAEKVDYLPGETVEVPGGVDQWQVTLWVRYDGMSFDHQLGQSKGAAAACESEPPAEEEEPVVVEPEGPVVPTPEDQLEGPDESVAVVEEWECVEGEVGPGGEECGVESLVQREFCLREPFNPICEVPEWTSPDEDLVPVDVAETEAVQSVPGGVPGELAVTGGGEIVGMVLLGAVALAAGVSLILKARASGCRA